MNEKYNEAILPEADFFLRGKLLYRAVEMIKLLSITLSLCSILMLSSCGPETIEAGPVWLEQGESLEGTATGKIYFFRIEEETIILKRKSEWVIPAETGSISVGNKEYLEILQIDREENTILVQISRRSSSHPFDF